MSLWTPYTQEAALDLSKSAVKSERTSPRPASSAPQLPLMPGYYATYTDAQHYYGYQYQPTATYATPALPCVPPATTYAAPAISPESNESWSHIKPNAPSSITSDSHDFFDTESLSEDMEYQMFERDALQAMAEKNGGTLLGNNPRMRRAVQTSQAADDSYRKQRERNNFAAKQSRDRRKLREVRLAFQVTYLKKKMAELKARMTAGVCERCRQI